MASSRPAAPCLRGRFCFFLFVEKILCLSLHKLIQSLAPALRNVAWIVASGNRIEHLTVHQELDQRLHFPLIWIKLFQGGSQRNSKLSRVEHVAVGQNQVNSAASLA